MLPVGKFQSVPVVAIYPDDFSKLKRGNQCKRCKTMKSEKKQRILKINFARAQLPENNAPEQCFSKTSKQNSESNRTENCSEEKAKKVVFS